VKRTYQNAVAYAQKSIREKMASEHRILVLESDTAELRALIARLLWHVPASEGGVMGLDDCARGQWTSRHVSLADVEAAAWAPGVWPEDERAAA
jgi:hypothetical protein